MYRKVVLSGVDETVPIRKLKELQIRYPHIRYGVLYSQDLKPRTRYPDEAWILKLHSQGVLFDLHLCKMAATTEADLLPLAAMISLAERVQWNIGNLNELTPEHAKHIVRMTFSKPAIIQIGDSVGPFYKVQNLRSEVHAFHDASRGKGITPTTYTSGVSISADHTGYGGGLTPINLAVQIPKILEASKGIDLSRLWIDAETGLRAHARDDAGTLLDDFNIDKAEAFVENAILHGW